MILIISIMVWIILASSQSKGLAQELGFSHETISVELTDNSDVINFIEKENARKVEIKGALVTQNQLPYTVEVVISPVEDGIEDEAEVEAETTEDTESIADSTIVTSKFIIPSAIERGGEFRDEINIDLITFFPSDVGETRLVENILNFKVKDVESGKELDYSIPYTLKLLTDDELAATTLSTSMAGQMLTYSSDSKPLLKYDLKVENLATTDFDEAYYEVKLVDSESGEAVQTLAINRVDIASGETKIINKDFQFELPPGDLVTLGENEYYLSVELRGRVGERVVTSSSRSEFFTIEVLSL